MTEKKPTQAEALAEPFSSNVIKKLKKGNASLDYVPVSEVISRLNSVLGTEKWSREILDAHRDSHDPNFVIAQVRVTATIDGETKVAEGVGGDSVTYKKDSKIVIDLGDTFKSAVSDAFKKACQDLGVALHLARAEEAMAEESRKAAEAETGVTGDDWAKFTGLVSDMDSKQKARLLERYTEETGSTEKPTFGAINAEHFDKLMEVAAEVSFNGEVVEEKTLEPASA